MKLIILFTMTAVYAAAFDNILEQEWINFKVEHDRKYNDADEDNLRYKIYLENRAKIAKHNTRYFEKKVSFKLDINKYADMLHNKFLRTLNGFNRSKSDDSSTYKTFSVVDKPTNYIGAANVKLQDAVDWRQKGAVTPVKDQGQCGSCWSFSVTGTLEGQHFLKTSKLVSLSEQNLVDCSSSYGNLGCFGGLMKYAYEYIQHNGGIDTEASYPYEAIDDYCRFKKKNIGATERGYVFTASGNEKALQNAVATIGPVSVAIDASHESFQFYSKGVYYEPKCSQSELDHAVLVVGYDVDKASGYEYWIVKNSWGTSWGEKGYIKMIKNKNNACGIASYASYPLV